MMSKILVARRAPFILPRPIREVTLPALLAGVRGEYRVQVFRRDGSVKHDTGWFPNIITDIGLDRLGSTSSDWLTWCRVGTGTAVPSVSDTQLQSQVASTSNAITSSNTVSSSPPYYTEAVRTYQFAQGAAAGNLAEVGIGWLTSGASLFSRARILDSLGAPTTITVLADEFLNVSYRVRYYAPAADRLGQFSIGSAVYDYTARAATVTSWNAIPNNGWSNTVVAYSGAIGAITGQPTGNLGAATTSVATYNAGTFYRDSQAVFAPTAANGTHRSYLLGASGMGIFQFEISPTIVKTNLDQLTMNFRIGWQRIVGTG